MRVMSAMCWCTACPKGSAYQNSVWSVEEREAGQAEDAEEKETVQKGDGEKQGRNKWRRETQNLYASAQ